MFFQIFGGVKKSGKKYIFPVFEITRFINLGFGKIRKKFFAKKKGGGEPRLAAADMRLLRL